MTKEKTPKISKQNIDLARQIVEQKAEITEWPNGFDVDMIGIIGVRHESPQKDKKKAIEEAAAIVAGMLQRGELVLSDTWAADNLKT